MNRLKTLIIPTLLLAGFLVFGCHDDGTNSQPSASVTTESMSADMHVSSSGGEVVTVEVTLKEGYIATGYFIDLEPGDGLKASVIGDPATIIFSENLFDNIEALEGKTKGLARGERNVFGISQDGIWYYTTLENKEENTEFTVSFIRAAHNDAPRSTVKLPPPFTITEPLSNQVFSRSGDFITVGWDMGYSGYPMRLKGFVSCLDNSSGEWSSPEITDTGSYLISAGTFNGYSGTCNISIGVERYRLGQLDPAFGYGGKIEAHQYRMITIYSVE